MPFILLSKKRYVGMLYETSPDKGKMKVMGLSLKRRDSCDYLKDTYGEILDILMRGGGGGGGEATTTTTTPTETALRFLATALDALVAGSVPMDKLTITKALRGYYKNPQQIAHAVLAERMAGRDPGNKPKPGDRMRFVHVVVSSTTTTASSNKLLQGDKIETTEYVLQKGLKVDYAFYVTNQLMKPLVQLFVLAVEDILKLRYRNKVRQLADRPHPVLLKYQADLRRLESEFGGGGGGGGGCSEAEQQLLAKRREKFQAEIVKRELFSEVLRRIEMDRSSNRRITQYFAGNVA